jgi:GH15 family glucan-1,4-alpha-glucosidase
MSDIGDYALIGDLHTAALIGREGSIDWLCLPRFDAPACFAALLGGPDAGQFRLAPADESAVSRRQYVGDTLILETSWETGDGTVRVLDFMPPRGEAADVVRIVEGVSGRVSMRLDVRLRFAYGRIVPWVHHIDQGMTGIAGPDAVWLHTDVPLHGEGGATIGEFTVAAGQRISFVLTHQLSHLPQPRRTDAEDALRHTRRFWRDWIGRHAYDGPWPDAVRRSLILLKALTYAPTGGLLAAVTTSLPERIGGSLNWDYRYCWLRDSTFTLQALLGTGYVEEAKAWREWLLRAIAGDPADLQIMYGLDGARWLPERTLDWLPGYRGSRPVRVGNAAAGQFQLDVWGEVLDGLHLSREAGLAPTTDAWDLQCALLDFLEGNWQRPDNGLWEVRGRRRHFVYSKVMAWAGFDRAVRAVETSGLAGPVSRWRSLRDAVHADVCKRGFDAARNTFTQSYGSSRLDAALLLMPRVGFLPYDDERVIGTVDAIQRTLSRDGLLLRYDAAEGVFVACSFWLVEALHMIGRSVAATALFERLLDLRNDVGMLSEEYDISSHRPIGNTPQAFSLVGLINAARTLCMDNRGTPAGQTRDQLYAEAQRRNLKGRSSMTKAQLEKALGH